MQEGQNGTKGRLVLVDDHPSYVHGLKALIEGLASDLKVVGVATEADTGIAMVEEHHPDLVLLDVHMPGRNGICAAMKITADYPAVKVAMLTVSEDPKDITECLQAGVCGYLSKQIEIDDLITSIRMLLRNESVFGTFVMPTLLQKEIDAIPLDEEDLAVLRMVAQGLGRAGIARQVAVSESSLKRMMRQIERKLGVENRIQAVAVAAKRGLI